MQCYIGYTGVTAEEISTRRPTFVPPWPSAPLLPPSPLPSFPVPCRLPSHTREPPHRRFLPTAPPPDPLVDLPPQVEATRGQSFLCIYQFPISSTMTPRRRCRKAHAHARTDDPPCPHASQCPQGRNLDSSAENIKQMRHAHAGRGTWPSTSLPIHTKARNKLASPDLPARAIHPDCMAWKKIYPHLPPHHS